MLNIKDHVLLTILRISINHWTLNMEKFSNNVTNNNTLTVHNCDVWIPLKILNAFKSTNEQSRYRNRRIDICIYTSLVVLVVFVVLEPLKSWKELFFHEWTTTSTIRFHWISCVCIVYCSMVAIFKIQNISIRLSSQSQSQSHQTREPDAPGTHRISYIQGRVSKIR